MTVFFAGHDEPQATEETRYPFQVPLWLTILLSGAVHVRIMTEHEAFA